MSERTVTDPAPPGGTMRDPAGADRTHARPPAAEPRWWLDEPRNVDRIVHGVYGVCALLLLADILVHTYGPFAIESLFGFYGIFGFVAYVALVVAAEALRAVVKRPEDYYDR